MGEHISPKTRAGWLKDYEGGKTETHIAKTAKSDKRTVKDNLQLAMMERAAATARVEVIKSTFLRHQDALLDELRELKSSLGAPPVQRVPISWRLGADQDMGMVIRSALARLDAHAASLEGGPIGGGASTMRALLMEHLKRDPLRKLMEQYQSRSDDYERALLGLALKVVNALESGTRLELVSLPTEKQKQLLFCENAGDMAFNYGLKVALRSTDDSPPIPEINAFIDEGEVRLDKKYVLAAAKGREEAVRKALVDALTTIKGLPEVQRVHDAHVAIESTKRRALSQVEELLMLGFLKGECRVCKKLGLWTPGGLRK